MGSASGGRRSASAISRRRPATRKALATTANAPILGFVTALEEERTEGALAELVRVLDRLPFVSSVKRDVQSLRELLYQRRAPRVALLGLPGSGRTALVNALLGKDALPAVAEPGWVRVDAEGALVDVLEISLGGGEETRALVRRALDESPADCVLLVCSADQVDGSFSEATSELGELLGIVGAKEAVAVLTHADTLPPRDAEPPYPEEKLHAVDVGTSRLRRVLSDCAVSVREVLGVSSRDGHGIRPLSELLVEVLPDAARLEAARAFPRAARGRRVVANRIVHSASTLALTVGLAPVPFSDVLVIAPLQVTMVSAVAHLSGRPWDKRAVLEWMASIGVVGSAGMGLRWTARQLLKLVPGAGTVVSAGVAGAGTVTIGQSAIAYFLRKDPRLLTEGAPRG